jgi:DNA-binding transcriptional LysR family regulator
MVKDVQRRQSAFERPHSDPLDLSLRSLDIFVQIAESGGMTPAARRMGLTQSAVSQVVANLEQSLGVQLFDRQVRPIALTTSGAVLLEKARGVLLSARDAINAARLPPATAFPKLNLCLVGTVAGTIGPGLVADIRDFAGQLSVHAGLHSQHNRSLLAREADIVISPDPLEDEPNLERYELLKEPFIVAVPKDYPEEVNSLAALAERLELVRFSSRTLLGRQIERHLRRLRVEAKGRVEFDTPDAVLAMVAGGVGWAALTPLCALLATAFWPQLKFVPMPEPVLYRRLYVIARQGELGDVPKKIADLAVAALKRAFNDKLKEDYPWMVAAASFPEKSYMPPGASRRSGGPAATSCPPSPQPSPRGRGSNGVP